MRIVNWNCCRGRHEAKLPPLLGLKPDVAVVQETPRPASQLAPSQLWHGTNERSGLLCLAFEPYRLEPVEGLVTEREFFLPATVTGPGRIRFNLLGVWTKAGKQAPLYLREFQEGMAFYRDFIASGPTIVVGDFNAYWCDDKEPFRQYGLVSAYHAWTGSTFREEKHPTYYFWWRKKRPYHFDYCLVPRRWRTRIERVEVGTYRNWTGKGLSDHCPLVVDLTSNASPVPAPSARVRRTSRALASGSLP